MRFSFACAATWNKLGIECLPDALNFEVFQKNNIAQYLECQPEFNSSIRERKINQMSNGIHPLQIIQNTPYFLLICVPQSLQPLYYHLTMASISQADSLPLVVFLTQCLMFLEDAVIDDSDYLLILSILESLFREYKLGRYATVLFWRNRSISEQDQYLPKEWDQFIREVQQMTKDQNDMQLFAASISLAGLYRAQHRCDQGQSTKDKLSINESEEVYLTITRISDPILHILALSTVLNMKDPSVFDEKQKNEIRSEMILLLKDCFTRIPLLTSTLLFIQCYRVCQESSDYFQEIIKEIITKLNNTFIDKRSQEAAYIALRSVNNMDLLYSLSQFDKQITNLSDLLQFNSTIFYHYMIDKTSFDASNRLLLSFMYLAEMTVDVQILQMYCKENQKKKTIWLIEDLFQLWNDSSKSKKIMTFEVATWITNYLQLSDRKEIQRIITDVFSCHVVEKKAYPVTNKWLVYQNVKDLKFFAYYAAYLSVQEGQNTSLFIDMIKNISNSKDRSYLTNIIKNLLELDSVDSIPILTNLVDIIQSAYQSSLWTSACIRSKEIFKLILNFEYKRIIVNMNSSDKSFLQMISDCSLNVQNYLAEYFYTFLESNHISNVTEDVYLAMIITWMINGKSFFHTNENFSKLLYEYIFIFIHDQRYPQVQKAILNAFNAVFMKNRLTKDHIFMSERVLITLEKIIYSYMTITTTNIYSEDILNSCLLAFGNRLLKSKSFRMNQIVSIEMQNIFETLSKTSSDCISARALLCLIFSKNFSIIFDTISNWLTTMPDLTPEKRYNILVQQLLYRIEGIFCNNGINEIIRLIQTYSDELLGKFITDLYTSLYNITNTNCLLNPTPDYILVAKEFISVNVVMFRNGVEKTIGEQIFKTELYNANKQYYNRLYVILYASFGVITNELIDMLACSNNIFAYFEDSIFKNIKNVSSRDVIENLFKHLKSTLDPEEAIYSFLFKLAFQLAQTNVISAFEIHECASSIINNIGKKCISGLSIEDDTRDPFDSLISLSCIEKDSIWSSPVEFFNQNDIDKNFQRDIQYFNDKSILFLRRNYFISNFD